MKALLRVWQPIDRALYRRRYGPATRETSLRHLLGPRPEGIVIARADLDTEQTAAAREHHWQLTAGWITLAFIIAALFYGLWRTGR